jgi:hypothetical protein
MDQNPQPENYHCICQTGIIHKNLLSDHLKLENNHYITPVFDSTKADTQQTPYNRIQQIKESRMHIYKQTLMLISKIHNKAMRTNKDLRKLEHDYEKILKGADHKEEFDKYVLALNRIDKRGINKAIKEYYQQFTIVNNKT